MTPDILLFTDGSGAEDKIGAYAAFAVNNHNTSLKVVGCASNTSVARSELMAFSEGLRAIYESNMYYLGVGVLWISDCQSMVDCFNGKGNVNSHKDLWLMVGYYSSKMSIQAMHIPRKNKRKEHEFCDLHASSLRVVLKEYILSDKELNDFTYKNSNTDS